MSKKEISFTEGPVFQSLLRFAIPVLGALILQAAYGAVDLLIVGKFGNASSISAVGTGSSFMQMATFIITSLAMGSTVIIGHHIGEQKPKEAGNAVGTTIILFLIIAVIMTFVLEFAAGGIAHLLQAPVESFDKTILYIRICSAGIVIIIAYNVIQRGAARCGKCKPSTSVRRNCLRHKYSGRFASGWSISHGCCGCRHCHCICTVCLCCLFCRCIKKAGYAYRIFQRTMSDL